MNNTKHTPGPWHVNQGTNGFCNTWQVSHTSPTRSKTIADCGAISNKVYQGDTENYIGEQFNKENHANAQLIAAAPDMLHALEKIYANAAESPEWIRNVIDQVLAKARGE